MEQSAELVKIYLLTDDKGLKYVGKTPRRIKQRICEHKYDTKRNGCSSSMLNLDNVSYEILEEVPNIKSLVKEREGYWIQNTDCVNQRRNLNDEQYKHYRVEQQRKRRLELKLTIDFLKILEEY